MLTTTHRLLRPLNRLPLKTIRISPVRDMTVLSKKSAEEYEKQNYTERMSRTGRPVSPHLTIYSWPIVALSSITNRVTGIGLYFGAFGVAALDIVGGSGTSLSLAQDIATSGGVVAPAAKFAVSFTFLYHYMGGLRHLWWDSTPEKLTNDDVKTSAYVLMGGSVLGSGILALI